jgi:thioredoxin reductase
VVVIDAGEPRNAPAAGVHAFLTRDGMPPAELVAAGRAEAERYGAVLRAGEVVDARRVDGGFEVALAAGDAVTARRVVVASGLADELPDVAGLRERWGRDVVHCPYCHGWEIRDEPIGVLGGDPMSVHRALLFRQWSPDVVLFTHTGQAPDGEEAEQLAARGVRVVTGVVEAIEVSGDAISGLRLAGGEVVPRAVVAVGTRMVARAAFLDGLGLKAVPGPNGLGERIEADPFGRTEVDGVWVAGNVTELFAQVVVAAAAGTTAGAQANADLVAEDTRLAVEVYREKVAS